MARLVKFAEDKYAIERGWIFKEYKDLNGSYWWNRPSVFFRCCIGTLDECNKVIPFVGIKPKKIKNNLNLYI